MLVSIQKNKEGLLEIIPIEGKQAYLVVANAEKVYLGDAVRYEDVIVGRLQACWGLQVTDCEDSRTLRELIGSRPFLYKGLKPVVFERFERAKRLIIEEDRLLSSV